MQTNNRFFDDLARVASGAASTVAGIRQEFDAMVRQRFERLISDMDLVTRDEFEAVKATATNARAEQETLARRVAILEATLKATASSPSAPHPDTATQGSGQPSPEDN
jgi:BMFP domain-containing protein YqiC